MLRLALLLALTAIPGTPETRASSTGPDWNPEAITWHGYEAGLAKAKATGKPVMAVVKASWCGACRNYERAFHTQAVVELAQKYVMVLVDADETPEAAGNLAPDGSYVPRTLFLDPKGNLRTDISGGHPRFRYFLVMRKLSSLTSRMERGLQPPAPPAEQ